jgi:hypothetical protein
MPLHRPLLKSISKVNPITLATKGIIGQLRVLRASGVDVMITIFCDFLQFSAKKLAFFLKTNVTIKILHNLALF